MTCKDCIHLKACCGFVPFDGTIEEKADHLDECLKKPCPDFKNKADFVEVVRCKDCKHFVSEVCRQDFAMYLSRADDFCSYGERRS